MNSKIALSGLSIFAALALIGGSTFAFFSSSATSTGNVFASGTLNLLVDDNNESTPAATVTASIGGTNMAPGGTTSGFISLHNNGSLPIAEVNLGATKTGGVGPDLATKLTITSARIGSEPTCTAAPADVTATLPGSHHLSDLNGANIDLPSTAIAVSGDAYLCMLFTFDSGTDDTFQGSSVTETFTLTGHQDLTQ